MVPTGLLFGRKHGRPLKGVRRGRHADLFLQSCGQGIPRGLFEVFSHDLSRKQLRQDGKESFACLAQVATRPFTGLQGRPYPTHGFDTTIQTFTQTNGVLAHQSQITRRLLDPNIGIFNANGIHHGHAQLDIPAPQTFLGQIQSKIALFQGVLVTLVTNL